MNKQKTQLIAMVIVLAVLIGGYAGLRVYNNVQANKSDEEEVEAIVIYQVDEESIVAFDYDYDDVNYAYVYDEENEVWRYAEDTTLDLEQSDLEDIVSTMAYLTAEDLITDVEDFDQYGLAEPSFTFSLETSDGETVTFLVGDYNDLISTYYFCIEGDTTVYTVTSSVVTVFELNVEDIIEEEEEEETEEDAEEEEADDESADTEEAEVEDADAEDADAEEAASDDTAESEDTTESDDSAESEDTAESDDSKEEGSEDAGATDIASEDADADTEESAEAEDADADSEEE